MGPLDRLLGDAALASAHQLIAEDLTGADLRSLMLAVAEARAAQAEAADVLAQWRNDRFCAPALIDAVAIAQATADALAAASAEFEPVQLSPLAPLATTSAVAPVPQNNVVTTMRLTEVLSDPTNALALEAALRRRKDRATAQRLCAAQRVVRAQRFDGPRSFAHFSLLGLISAGRDRGDRAFEVDELTRHIRSLIAAITSIDGGADVVVTVSDHSGRLDEAQAIVDALDVEAWVDPDRAHGQGYYEHLCCKVGIRRGDEIVEVGDGGSTGWTRQLLSDRKERLVISGLGLDRIVM